jgi:hypothetical protein
MFLIDTVIAWHKTIMNSWYIIISTLYYLPIGHYIQQEPSPGARSRSAQGGALFLRASALRAYLADLSFGEEEWGEDASMSRRVMMRSRCCSSVYSEASSLFIHQLVATTSYRRVDKRPQRRKFVKRHHLLVTGDATTNASASSRVKYRSKLPNLGLYFCGTRYVVYINFALYLVRNRKKFLKFVARLMHVTY